MNTGWFIPSSWILSTFLFSFLLMRDSTLLLRVSRHTSHSFSRSLSSVNAGVPTMHPLPDGIHAIGAAGDEERPDAGVDYPELEDVHDRERERIQVCIGICERKTESVEAVEDEWNHDFVLRCTSKTASKLRRWATLYNRNSPLAL